VRFVAKRSLFHVPVFGTALRLTGQIPVDRANRDAAVDSFAEAGRILREGGVGRGLRRRHPQPRRVAAVIQEGRVRARDQPAGPLRSRLHRRGTGADARGGFVPRPGTVEVRIGLPIPTAGLTYEDRDALRQRCWQAMSMLASG
jgi:1-acyl-sn-glycerol-3-phosphate acyltransferase